MKPSSSQSPAGVRTGNTGRVAHKRDAAVDGAADRAGAPCQTIAAALIFLLLANPAWADSTATKNGGGEWVDSVTWTNGIPSGADTATIYPGDAVSVAKPGCGAGTILLSGEIGVHAGQPPDFLKGALGVGNFIIGVAALGQVHLDTGATIASNNVTLGYQLGSGYITVDGAANLLGDRAIWTNSGEFIVGGSSAAAVDGTVMLSNRGTIESRNTFIASGTSTGTVNINNATWTNTNLFSVGHGGTQATLRIENHGVLNDLTGEIGDGLGGPGTLTGTLSRAFIDNATWNNSGDFYIGGYAQAQLNVSAGGVVTNTNAYIGNGVGSAGSATFTDGTWTNSGSLFVGFYGAGSLQIKDGSTVTSTSAVIGRYGEAIGSVVVDNGTWTNTNELYVASGVTGLPGSHAVGQLIVKNGGKVTCSYANIGFGTGSTGTVQVMGMNSADSASIWTLGSELYIGERGTGSLAISDGGIVKSPSTFIGTKGVSAVAGTLEINGTAGRRGVLETGRIFKVMGTISFNGGVLRATSDRSEFTSNIASVSVGTNGAYVDTNGHNIGVDAAFGGAGGLIKQGAGTLDLRSNNILGGVSVAEAGKLLVNGSLTGNMLVNSGATLGGSGHVIGSVTVLPGGILSPGNSPGNLTIDSLALGPHSVLEMQLGDTSDHLSVPGNLVLGGTLKVSFTAGFVPSAGLTFNIWSAATSSSGFTGYVMPALPAGLFWHTGAVNTTGVLSIASIKERFTSFLSFAVNYALPGEPAADDDADGLSNIVEYGLGLNPQGPDTGNPGIPKLSKSGSNDVFSFDMPEIPTTDVVTEIQSSTDLLTWPVLATRTGSGLWTGPLPPSASAPVAGMQTVTLTQPDGGGIKKFYRLSLRILP